jgi:hypothetical protein
MAANATTVPPEGNDDALTVCAISVKRVIFDRVLGSRGVDTLLL